MLLSRNDGNCRSWLNVHGKGLALKLFADFQNEKMIEAGIIGDAQLRGLWALSDTYRDVAGVMMVVLRSADHR